MKDKHRGEEMRLLGVGEKERKEQRVEWTESGRERKGGMDEHGRRERWKERGGEENCNREIRGGIDGFIRQDDTEGEGTQQEL